jgi:hypothetical protein
MDFTHIADRHWIVFRVFLWSDAMTVTGLSEVLKNLNREIKEIEGKTMAGLLAGGLVIQGEAQRRVPVEYGNLRGSAYTRKAQDGGLAVEVGFTAAYALFVHENLEQKLQGIPRPSGLGDYWGPAGEPKFLERAAADKSSQVVEMVRAYAKVTDGQ